MIKQIGDKTYDCIPHDTLAALLRKSFRENEYHIYVSFKHSSKEQEYNYLKAESKFLKWAMKEGCPRMILRDYDVRYSMKNWRYDYQ